MRDIKLEDTIYPRFTTRAFATGIPTVLAGTPVLSIYEENNLTQITSGVSVSVDYDSVVGLNQATIVATAANGYEAGKSYDLVITTGTVGGVSVVGEVVGSFSVQSAPVNWARVTAPTTAVDLSATDIQLVDTATVSTTATNLTNAPTNGDLTATMKTSVTTAATAATPIAASVSGNVDGSTASVTGAVGSVTGNVGGSTASVVGAVGSVTGAVGSVTGAVGSVAGNVDGSTASVTGSVGSVVGAVGSVTGAVGSVAGNVDGSTASVTGAVGSVTGAVGSVTGNVGGNVTGSVGSNLELGPAEVNAEVVDALATDTYAEPGQGAPTATTSLAAKINYLYKAWRNKTEQTATTLSVYDDAGTTVDQKSTVSDDTTTATKGEIVSGP